MRLWSVRTGAKKRDDMISEYSLLVDEGHLLLKALHNVVEGFNLIALLPNTRKGTGASEQLGDGGRHGEHELGFLDGRAPLVAGHPGLSIHGLAAVDETVVRKSAAKEIQSGEGSLAGGDGEDGIPLWKVHDSLQKTEELGAGLKEKESRHGGCGDESSDSEPARWHSC